MEIYQNTIGLIQEDIIKLWEHFRMEELIDGKCVITREEWEKFKPFYLSILKPIFMKFFQSNYSELTIIFPKSQGSNVVLTKSQGSIVVHLEKNSNEIDYLSPVIGVYYKPINVENKCNIL